MQLTETLGYVNHYHNHLQNYHPVQPHEDCDRDFEFGSLTMIRFPASVNQQMFAVALE